MSSTVKICVLQGKPGSLHAGKHGVDLMCGIRQGASCAVIQQVGHPATCSLDFSEMSNALIPLCILSTPRRRKKEEDL